MTLTRAAAGLAVAAALAVAAMIWLVPGSAADAEAPRDPELLIQDTTDADGTQSVLVQLDPGSTRMGALSGSINYDPEAVQVAVCEAIAPGACNDLGDGEILFGVFSVEAMVEITDLVTIEFEGVANIDETVLELLPEIAVDAEAIDVAIDSVEAIVDLIDDAGAISGEVLDALSAAGIYDVEVCASRNGEEPVCVDTSGLGAFLIDGLEPGDYHVTVSSADDVISAEATVTVRPSTTTTGVSLVAGQGASGPDDSQPSSDAKGGTITGSVIDPDSGIGIFGVEVCATRPMFGTESCAYTSTDGTFSIPGLASDNYVVSASDRAQRFSAFSTATVGVTNGSTATIELTIDG